MYILFNDIFGSCINFIHRSFWNCL